MQSRKSSILKPRKVREPLQDLNQLLPNNDDEETTITDAQRRRVSFASMNKVKEYETASESVAVIIAPPSYDKRYSLSTDLFQPENLGKNVSETYQVSSTSRKSIQNTSKINTARQSIVPDENVYFEEDVELTETIGRIYDIPMKSSGDSSMEMTHVITQTEIQFDEQCEEIGEVVPLNLTKENFNLTSSFTDANIVEIEIVNKNEKDADTSSMETTEVISSNIIRIEKPDTETLSMETTEVITNTIRIENPHTDALRMETSKVISYNFEKIGNEDTSSMETTEVIYDNMLCESIKSQSACYETLQSSRAIDDTAEQDEEIEYVSVRNFESPNGVPKRKSIFEMSARPLSNWENHLDCNQSRANSNCDCSSLKLLGSDESKLISCDDSLSLTCQETANKIDNGSSNKRTLSQEIEHRLSVTNQPVSTEETEEIMLNSCIKTYSQETGDKTKYDILSMQLLSQETDENKNYNASSLLLVQHNKTKYNNSNMELLTQEDDKTKCNNSNMELLTQEDKIRCNSFSVQLLNPDDKTKFNNSNMELQTQENKTKCNNSNMELLTQEDNTQCLDSALESAIQGSSKTMFNNSNLRLPSEGENQIKFLNASVQVLTQDENEATEKSYRNLEVHGIVTPLKKDATNFNSGQSDLSKVLTPAVDVNTECESIDDQVAPSLSVDPQNTSLSQQITDVNSEKLCDLIDAPLETTLKSSLGDDSSANNSNSPLTVGVNFSIFQKNKETRVEFSGTIDSNKKRKSISSVKVNIINNKSEKDNKRVKELRFSMPATTKISREPENKKSDFSATFTDFSIPNENSSPSSDNKVSASETFDKRCDNECPQPMEPAGIVTLNSFDNTNDSNVQLTKSTKKRVSIDAFFDVDENEVCPKRRSLSNDVDDSDNIQNPLPTTQIESNVSSAQLIKHSFTEIKQRKESFIREEKSIHAVDDMVVETCTRSTNMNISYEARQTVTVADCEEKPIEQEESAEEQTHSQTYSSSTNSSANDAKAKDEEYSTRTNNEMGNDQFSEGESASQSQSINQLSSQEDELNDFSLHNPSIIVNIGDSFSHYKSMDLGTDINVSVSDVRELVDGENEVKPVIDYIDSDDISKENFVVEWLQYKTGKVNVDTRLFASSSDCSTLSTIKSLTRGSEKPSITTTSDTVRLAQNQDTELKCTEIMKSKAVHLTENDSKKNNTSTCGEPNEVCKRTKLESEKVFKKVDPPNLDSVTRVILENSGITNVVLAEKIENNFEQNANVIPIPKVEPEKNENSILLKEAVEENVLRDEVKIDSEQYVNQQKVPDLNNVSLRTNDVRNRMELLSDGNDSNSEGIEQPEQVTTASNTTKLIPCVQEAEELKSTSKTRQCVDPVFVNSESLAEKRLKMSPEFERNKMETERIIRYCNILDAVDGGQKKNIETKKQDRPQHRYKKFETTRKDILEKIMSLSNNGNQRWKLKIVSDDRWIFQFFYDQLELIIEFSDDESSNTCNASCQFVQPPNVKFYEISKIAVEYLIRKNESKLKKICHSVEDVPYLLKLIEPDVLFIEGFVADILRLCDSEIFRIKNGRAVFYVYSFKNIMSAKVQININRLEKLSVKDIQVEEIVGKADLNLVRNTFSEVGRDSDFFSKFVKKLWIVLDQ